MILTILFYLFVNMLWCSVGYRWFAAGGGKVRGALPSGIVRTFLWWCTGLLVLYSSMALQATIRDGTDVRMTAYIFLYVPLTWIAWCVTARFIVKKKTTLSSFLFGGSIKQFLWRAFGTVLSLIIEFPNTFLWVEFQRVLYERAGN